MESTTHGPRTSVSVGPVWCATWKGLLSAPTVSEISALRSDSVHWTARINDPCGTTGANVKCLWIYYQHFIISFNDPYRGHKCVFCCQIALLTVIIIWTPINIPAEFYSINYSWPHKHYCIYSSVSGHTMYEDVHHHAQVQGYGSKPEALNAVSTIYQTVPH